jgi:hypothetical protein
MMMFKDNKKTDREKEIVEEINDVLELEKVACEIIKGDYGVVSYSVERDCYGTEYEVEMLLSNGVRLTVNKEKVGF